MPNPRSWIVCETSGRWTAALRVALARQNLVHAGRIQEVRSLPEVSAAQEASSALVLVEVRPDNLAASMNWFLRGWQHGARAVALLGGELSADQVAEALLEAGALAVIESPRHVAAVFGLAGRVAASRLAHAKKSGSVLSIAERAWAALPWQDA
jgi:hypothetical protein